MNLSEIYFKEHIENNLTYSEIREKYNISRGKWDYHIRQKLKLSNDKRKFRPIDNYFSKIDTETKSYILGFLYADGYITNDYRIGLLINHKDYKVAKFILNELCPSKELNYCNYTHIKRDPQVRFRLKSIKMWNDLINLGFSITKTTTNSNIFKKIPNNLKWDFIRGFFDGDGCIYKRRKKSGYDLTFANGSDLILKDIKEFLESNNIKSAIYFSKNCYSLKIFRSESVYFFCKYVYENKKFSLERKQNKALDIISSYNTELT